MTNRNIIAINLKDARNGKEINLNADYVMGWNFDNGNSMTGGNSYGTYTVIFPHTIDAIPVDATIVTNNPESHVYGDGGCAVFLESCKYIKRNTQYKCVYTII